ncbi:hypothetical protein QYE76_001965 [Lolium multiflorum]|uniref:CCHC-type domain-containing protein n=1 Tax=Lolium multiflorum TaxID=4521 RepID=A0AAD8RLN5_LOLMU|nr:hypothetical protein QYE76_001965 [Lolium multiflorum]
MRLPVSSSLRRRLRLPHPVRRRAPTAGTVGLRNPASREPVRVRGNQVFGERSGATTGSTTSSSDDEFLHTDNFFPDLSDFFDNLNMGDNDAAVNATDARPEGPLSAEEREKFEKVDAMFKAALFSILGDNIVDPYMAFDHGKDAWDALEAKFGVSDAGTELYVMEQYYDYRMTDERSVVEQAHEIQSLAKELEQFKCTLPDKFVAGGIIAKLPPSWRNFATSLKHKRQEFSVSDLIGSLHVEEKARAKDTRARSFEGGSSANVVQKKNFQSHKSKNKNNGKGKFDEKNKASNSTNFKKKTPYKKKGNCHVCGAPGHWAPDCPERHDRRGNSGKSANVVIGVDTEMKDVARTCSVLMGNGSRASVRGVEHFDNPVEDDNEAPKRSKRQRTAKSFGHDFIVYLVDDTPTSISEAYASQDADYWKEAVRSEMDSILANGTWEVTDRPYGCKPVGCKWVFKKKLRPDGTIEKYKARLVAKGYTQKEDHWLAYVFSQRHEADISFARYFLNLVVREPDTGRYALHRIRLSKNLFYEATENATAQDVAKAREAADAKKKNGGWPSKFLSCGRLPRPEIFFSTRPSLTSNRGSHFFSLLPAQGEGCVMFVDQSGSVSLYDADMQSVVAMTRANFCKPVNSITLSMANASRRFGEHRLYPLGHVPPWLQYSYGALSSASPPFAAAVVDSSTICASSKEGTYAFDMARGVWRQAGRWTLPFHGAAEYVPEFRLWFGLEGPKNSYNHRLCALDLASTEAPASLHAWDYLHALPDGWYPSERHLVNLDLGRFCIATRCFYTPSPEEEHDVNKAKVVTVLTGVEVVRAGDGLQMIKHKSRYYSHDENMEIHCVL